MKVALATAAWVSSAHALDRAAAIEVAKRQVRSQCGAAMLCSFDARLENNKWYVRVEFTKPGRPAIFVIDQSGKVVGRIEGR